ncbi:hypothetical protein [Halobacteriovorax marinus]|uniref:hypothetical protein n=1 Tax=Halobacteriovorax marinus TaxID=97084 RepID=UPI003A93E0BE
MQFTSTEELELLSSKEIEKTNSYKLFKRLQANNVPSDKATVIAIEDKGVIGDSLKKGQLKQIRKYVYDGLNQSSFMDNQEMIETDEYYNTQDFFSRFYFLNSHHGLRKSVIHTLVGESGQGKSTLLRPIIIDSARFSNVLVMLSEDDVRSFRYQLTQFAQADLPIDRVKSTLSRIKVISELDHDFHPQRDFHNWFQLIYNTIKANKIEAFFYDNISTGIFAEEFSVQKDVLHKLKKLAADCEIPVFLVTHPTKGALRNDLYLTSDHIRGNKSLSTISQIIYCINTCPNLTPRKTYIYLQKSRFHPSSNNTWYDLNFEKKTENTGYFTFDRRVSYSECLKNLKDNRKL